MQEYFTDTDDLPVLSSPWTYSDWMYDLTHQNFKDGYKKSVKSSVSSLLIVVSVSVAARPASEIRLPANSMTPSTVSEQHGVLLFNAFLSWQFYRLFCRKNQGNSSLIKMIKSFDMLDVVVCL